jgi:cytochrome c-type biogenesis protein CcmH/NrfG
MLAPPAAQPAFGPLIFPFRAIGGDRPLAGPVPPPRLMGIPAPPVADPAQARRPDQSRSSQLATIGDRLYRAGNIHRAAERYAQALSADPTRAAPRVRLAQIAIVRGQYAVAANHYREALIAEPGWLLNAPDIQALYGEPTEFARQVAKLETHVQADPNDRDAWFTLGAQLFLSGKPRQASDIFVRLSDRKTDASLTAFLDAATPRAPAAR